MARFARQVTNADDNASASICYVREYLHVLNPHRRLATQFNFSHDAVPGRTERIRYAMRVNQMSSGRKLGAIVQADGQTMHARRERTKVSDVRRDEAVVRGKFFIVHPNGALPVGAL